MRAAAQAKLALMLAIAAVVCSGCQQAEIIFHRHQPLTIAAAETPAPSTGAERVDNTILARYEEPEQPQPKAADSSSSRDLRPRVLDTVSSAAGLMSGPAPRTIDEPSPSVASPQPSTQPSAPPATQPGAPSTTQPGYTAPGVAVRYAPLGVGLASAAIGVPDTVGGGREAAEAQVFGSTALLTGAPGLAAAPPTVLGTVNGAQGLVGGTAPGIGRAGPNNILNLQLNPASGPNGRNAELIRAGFPSDRIPSGGQRASRR